MTTDTNINNVCIVSVNIIVFIPPLKVYNHIRAMVIITVIENGMLKLSKTNSCNTLATRNNRNAAPTVLDIKKAIDPVL